MDKELKDWLLEIVQQETWDEDDLAEWANDFMDIYDRRNYEYIGFDENRVKQEMAKIDVLESLVTEYKHDLSLPELPMNPDGSLYGIGFIYDEDNDTRVLGAIDQLKDKQDIVALAEHEGFLEIYSRLPTGVTDITVCDDEWGVDEYIPYHGQWIIAKGQFTNDCVAQVIGYRRKKPVEKKPAAWQGEPSTDKQVSFLRALGYTGEAPATKAEAGALIAQYKAKKVT